MGAVRSNFVRNYYHNRREGSSRTYDSREAIELERAEEYRRALVQEEEHFTHLSVAMLQRIS